jgi:hypothetical protein
LKGDALARQADPAHQRLVVREHLERRLVGDADVLRIAGERRPSERPLALAEQRPDVLGHEARDVERVGHAGLTRLRADVVAVVEGNRAPVLEHQHGAHVRGHRRHGSRDVVLGIAIAQPVRFVERHAVRDVAVQRIVCRRLVGQDVRRDAAGDQRRQHVRRIRAQGDRPRHAVAGPARDCVERCVEAVGRLVEVTRLQPAGDALRVDLDDQSGGAVHRRRQRLGPTHAAQAGGDHKASGQSAPEMAACDFRQSFVRALHDALAADVDPAAGGHLTVHRQPALLEVAEVFPGGPGGDQQSVGDEHARRTWMSLKHADRLAGLDEQRFVVLERLQRSDNRVERFPVARRLARSAVDDQIVRALGDVGIQIVHQHPHRGFLRPALAGQRGAARRSDGACCSGHEGCERER